MHHSKIAVVFLLACVSFITGCASTLLSDDRLKSNTAGVLGVPENSITITDRREEMPNTYYTATTKNGKKYQCSVNGGSIIDAGMVSSPNCAKK